jgi:HEAT repeat protein
MPPIPFRSPIRHAARSLRGGVLAASAAICGCAGNVNDSLEEARRGDPEAIRESVVLLGDLLRQKEKADYPYDKADLEAVQYLREVAEKSGDEVNRACAIDALAKLLRPDATDLFIGRLEDPSWIVQLESAKALAQHPQAKAAAPLVKRLEEETRMEVRLEILKALAAVGGDDALRAILAAFLDRTARYKNMRLAAYDGLRKLSGKEYAFEEIEKWRAFQGERFPPAAGKPSDKPDEKDLGLPAVSPSSARRQEPAAPRIDDAEKESR